MTTEITRSDYFVEQLITFRRNRAALILNVVIQIIKSVKFPKVDRVNNTFGFNNNRYSKVLMAINAINI